VVGIEAVNATNTAGGIHFDSTVGVFDTLVVNEYLNGTGNQGGPLVTSFNVSSRSDLRLYESDNNATMIKLGSQGAGFLNTCSGLLQRMIEVVPRDVKLSSIITPQQVKPINATLDFDGSGNLIFKGYIRASPVLSLNLIQSNNLLKILTPTTSSAHSIITLTTSPKTKSMTLIPEPATGSSVFGTTHFYPFSTSVTPTFHFFAISNAQLKVHTFSVQASVFVIPSLSSLSADSASFTIASLSHALPNVSVAAPIPQSGTLGPTILTLNQVELTSEGSKGGYNLWNGSIDFGAAVTGNVSVEVWEAGVVKDFLMLG